MVRELKNKGFEPLQFKFHREQPDLTKLDKLFGLMSTETATFDQEINRLETKFKLEGITKMFEGITMNTVGWVTIVMKIEWMFFTCIDFRVVLAGINSPVLLY